MQTRVLFSNSVGMLPRLPPRAGALLLVGGLHLLLILGLTTWAPGIKRVMDIAPLEVQLLAAPDEQRENAQLPPPPILAMQPVTMVQPDVELTFDTPPAENAITIPPAAASVPTASQPAAQPRIISDVAYLKPPAPRYPPDSRRSREQGLVSLRVLIDEKGHAREVRVHRSSGFPRLDEAARLAVTRALFRPYVEAGVARQAIVIVPIEFALSTRSVMAQGAG